MKAMVFCNGGMKAKSIIDRNELTGNCQTVLSEHGEILECKAGCIGLGSCIEVCRLKAISINKFGTAEVDMEKCVGCKLCLKVCPKGLIKLIEPEMNIMPRCSNDDTGAKARAVCDVSCIGCKICEKNCPVDAIKIIDNHAVIDEKYCVNCGMCATKCPRGTIVDSYGIFTG